MAISNRNIPVKGGESVDRALKRLKTKLDSEGILEEMRRLRAHESTADRKIRKARTAPKRNKARWKFQSEGQERERESEQSASL